MRLWWTIAALMLVVALGDRALSDGALSAHHSIAGAYDSNRPVVIDAVVTRFRFVNPHPYLDVTVPEASGPGQPWRLEMDNRGELASVGMSAETFREGDRIQVTGSLSRTVPNALYVRKLRRPADGFIYEQVGASPRISREAPSAP